MALRDSKSDLAASAQVLPNTDFLGRTSEDRQPIRIIVDLAALIRPIVAVNTQGIAFESQSKAERLNRTVLHFLPNQMMDEEGV